MTSPIDPIRPGRPARRTAKARTGDATPDPVEHIDNLPVPAGPARTVPRTPAAETEAVFAAHLLGQDGQKRGLRGGPAVIEAAKTLYNRTEWSGEKDRRSRKGRAAKTEI